MVRGSCLDDVDACDLYVLILGHRYGFQPLDGNPEGLSITYLETRRAGQRGIPRIALVRISIRDLRLSEMESPARAALVLAFRDEVAREVCPAEFSDLHGLIQGLSTGVLAELEKLGQRPDGLRAGVPVLRLSPRLPFLAGREELLARVDARLADAEGRGCGWRRCADWVARGRRVWRWSTRTVSPKPARQSGLLLMLGGNDEGTRRGAIVRGRQDKWIRIGHWPDGAMLTSSSVRREVICLTMTLLWAGSIRRGPLSV
jgi:Domain of unknown function (DUF4062)